MKIHIFPHKSDKNALTTFTRIDNQTIMQTEIDSFCGDSKVEYKA